MGEDKHDGLAIPGQIVLAHEPPFTIGRLRVEPSTRQVVSDGSSETLEPRVMQVLVALGRANGGIVTRDELIDWCWGGRIVGEDAINRAIFRLRQVAAEIGDGSFGVETITKVGPPGCPLDAIDARGPAGCAYRQGVGKPAGRDPGCRRFRHRIGRSRLLLAKAVEPPSRPGSARPGSARRPGAARQQARSDPAIGSLLRTRRAH